MKFLKKIIRKIGLIYVKFICKKEFNNQNSQVEVNERPIEYAFVFEQLVKIWPKRILDVGTGLTALPHSMRSCGFHVTAIDNIKDYWPTDITNRHYHVIDDDIRNSKLTGHWDVITCISVLEHIVEYKSAIKSIYLSWCDLNSLTICSLIFFISICLS